MPIPLKADIAVQVLIGPAVAVGDGFTPVTNLVGASADVYELIKDNGATAMTAAAPTNALAAISGADGYYNLLLAIGDVGDEGKLYFVCNDNSLILPIRHEFVVVPANVYDAFYAVAGTDTLKVDVVEASATQAEPGQSNPGATLNFIDKISFLYKGWRNKQTNDGTTIKLQNDADTATDQKAPVSEAAGVVTRGEWISGP